MLRIGVDLDGVMFDFDGRMLEEFAKLGINFSSAEEMNAKVRSSHEFTLLHRKIRAREGFFRRLQLLPRAKDYLEKLREKHDVYLVSMPEVSNLSCYKDKLENIAFYLGEDMVAKTILTTDKTLVSLHILIDDRKVIKGCMKPTFHHIHFQSWTDKIMDEVRMVESVLINECSISD